MTCPPGASSSRPHRTSAASVLGPCCGDREAARCRLFAKLIRASVTCANVLIVIVAFDVGHFAQQGCDRHLPVVCRTGRVEAACGAPWSGSLVGTGVGGRNVLDCCFALTTNFWGADASSPGPSLAVCCRVNINISISISVRINIISVSI